jgi:hypothetical protein
MPRLDALTTTVNLIHFRMRLCPCSFSLPTATASTGSKAAMLADINQNLELLQYFDK